jgi:hypothetical protein
VLPFAYGSNQTGNRTAGFHQSADAVVHLTHTLLDTERVVRHLGDRHELPVRQPPGKARSDRAAVPDYADLEVVAHVLALRAPQDERGKKSVDRVGNGVALALAGVDTPGVVHGTGLVDEKEECGRLASVDFRCVCHRSVSAPAAFS